MKQIVHEKNLLFMINAGFFSSIPIAVGVIKPHSIVISSSVSY